MGVRFLLATSAAQSETTYKLFYVPTSLAVIAYLSLVGNKADW
jgi:hypothetical protein